MYEQTETVDGKVIKTEVVSLETLNSTAIGKLHELISSLDAKSEPDLIRSCIDSLAKLNTSIKGSDILRNETNEERHAREAAEILEAELNG